MVAKGLLGTDEERAARHLVETASGRVEGTLPKTFLAHLFGGAVAEDLLRYTPEELAAFATSTWAFAETRKPGVPKIRFERVQNAPGDRSRQVSVIEILNDDMPFLVDSVMAELTELGLDVRLVVHPVFTVERDAAGKLKSFRSETPPIGGALRESLIQIHVELIQDDVRRTEIVQAMEQVLANVRACVQDWRPMLARVGEAIAELKTNPPPLPADEIAEAIQFLEWLVGNNFTFLGVRDYVLTDEAHALDPVFESGLGLLRSRELRVMRRGDNLLGFTPEMRASLAEPQALIITKATTRARVHRRVFMDYVGVKRFDAEGNLVGEFRILGLFTSTAYIRSTRSIPYLRRKVQAIVTRARFDPEGHSGKALVNVLESYPRDELFQIDEETLFHFALAILQLDERPRVRVLARRDRFDRFVSVLVFVPRDRYDSHIRRAIGDYLSEVYKGRVNAFYPFFPEGPLVRVHFIIGVDEGEIPNIDRAVLETAVANIVRTWIDELSESLGQAHDPAKARGLLERYRDAFSIGYREAYSPLTALEDIKVIEGLSASRPLGVDFHRRAWDATAQLGLKVYSYSRPIPLSERVPVLENMGFKVVDERTYHVTPPDPSQTGVWLHDMLLERQDGGAIDFENIQHALEASFHVTMSGGAENDGYNALVLAVGMMWRDVALIRALSRFLRQIRVPYSQDYMWATLRKHAAIAEQIVHLFHTRFDPRPGITVEQRRADEDKVAAAIETALGKVESLDEDRILRHFVNAVQSALRTNFFQLDKDGHPKPVIAVKYDSRKLEGLPLPRPLYEIFVYSPRVEGVHLRFGKVARGGIRWSDRPQDFRTEVLGLVKAQQVKNAVIVPVGAKGGFVPKLLPKAGNRDAIQAEGIAAYKLFIGTLLDVTDNIGADGSIVPPEQVVRHDGDDPYLVVAADKGTATFSDIANAISVERGHWLGDAFASGGSAGYDHKAMGITARGAWEAVKRHFREMDVNVGTTQFTVAGVGDMSGDVFGNGMLREHTIKLVAAFDHRDIFLDPNPDPEKSFAERARMFALPRSSWQDYDKSLISAGGGVHSRAAKEIPLSPEVQALLGLSGASATPQAVMRAILTMQADLLWFGGIGTYVRASTEGDEAAGDRANDPLRVTAADLRCKVIGEGANLGMTQRGRIEASRRGIRLNTDAIDNSAGVNTSDVEVNIKIALSIPAREGKLDMPARNLLLAEMTDEVAGLVLRNNYQQTLSLSLSERRGLEEVGFLQRLMQLLETRGLLDRAVEFLPDDIEIEERRRRMLAFTRPELSVLLAYAKLTLHSELLDSAIPDDPYLGRELGRYFPKALGERFPDALQNHRLRRDIIATQLANSMINRGGPSLTVRIADQTGAASPQIVAAFAAVRDSYGMPEINGEIDSLDNKVAGATQLGLYAAVQDLLLDRLVWFLRNVDLGRGLEAIVSHYRTGIGAVEAALDTALSPDALAARTAREAELQRGGVPEGLARRIANLGPLAAAPDIILVSERSGKPVAQVTATYFATEAFFKLERIAQAAQGVVVSDYFDRLALDRALDSIGEAERRLTAAMLANGTAGAPAVEAWIAEHRGEVERTRAAIHEIAGSGMTLSKLSVAASLLGDLVKQ